MPDVGAALVEHVERVLRPLRMLAQPEQQVAEVGGGAEDRGAVVGLAVVLRAEQRRQRRLLLQGALGGTVQGRGLAHALRPDAERAAIELGKEPDRARVARARGLEGTVRFDIRQRRGLRLLQELLPAHHRDLHRRADAEAEQALRDVGVGRDAQDALQGAHRGEGRSLLVAIDSGERLVALRLEPGTDVVSGQLEIDIVLEEADQRRLLFLRHQVGGNDTARQGRRRIGLHDSRVDLVRVVLGRERGGRRVAGRRRAGLVDERQPVLCTQAGEALQGGVFAGGKALLHCLHEGWKVVREAADGQRLREG